MPGVAGPHEPPRARFDLERMRAAWGRAWFWRSGERPAAEGSVANDPIDPERGRTACDTDLHVYGRWRERFGASVRRS